MCVEIVLGDKLIENIGDLQDVTRGDIIFHEGYDMSLLPSIREGCLCPVNIEATAEALGWVFIGNDDRMYYEAESVVTAA